MLLVLLETIWCAVWCQRSILFRQGCTVDASRELGSVLRQVSPRSVFGSSLFSPNRYLVGSQARRGVRFVSYTHILTT